MADIVTGFSKVFLPKKEAEKRRLEVSKRMKKSGLRGYEFGLMPNITGKLFAVTIDEKRR